MPMQKKKMPMQKTHHGAKKQFTVTASGRE